MSDPTPTTPPPAGWYPDPYGRTSARWWDGVQWTDHPAPPLTVAIPKAPEGTKTGTIWIWLVAFVPLLSVSAYFLIDWNAYFSLMTSPTSASSTAAMSLFPGFIAAGALGMFGTLLPILFAFLDYRALRARGVPQPFHWAFAFVALAVSYAGLLYPIGRGVVARRRAGGSLPPMIAAIAVFVVVFIVSGIWAVLFLSRFYAAFSAYAPIT